MHNKSCGTYIPLISDAVRASPRILKERATPMSLKDSFIRWRQYRQTCNELNRMSERDLNDLGICRSDIPFVARRTVS